MTKATIATVDQKLSDLISVVKEIKADNKSMDRRISETDIRITKLEEYNSFVNNSSNIIREWKMWVPSFIIAVIALGISIMN